MKPKRPKKKPAGPAPKPPVGQAVRDSMERAAKLAGLAASAGSFPAFTSLAAAKAYTDKTGDAYYEICYHLEGDLNLSQQALYERYATATPAKRPPMQTGLVRQFICPAGWPRHPQTLVGTLMACARFSHEDTSNAYLVNEAMTALLLEKQQSGTLQNSTFDRRNLVPLTPADAEKVRGDLLRLCDWIESRIHYLVHSAWYACPDGFSADSDIAHLANLGLTQRHLAKLSERDRERWAGLHLRAALTHQANLKMWGVVGRVQHDPQPRIWTHPHVDALIIALWPLLLRFNWTYADLLKVLDRLLPTPADGSDRRYPLDSVESFKVHCRTICGLTKTSRGKTAAGLPAGWPIAEQLYATKGK